MSPQIGQGNKIHLGRILKEQSSKIDELTKTIHNLTIMLIDTTKATAELKVQPEPPEP